MKRQESIFWKESYCPACGYCAEIIYTPDLLRGPVHRVCRRGIMCTNRWDEVASYTKKQKIAEQLRLVYENDGLLKQVEDNKRIMEELGENYESKKL